MHRNRVGALRWTTLGRAPGILLAHPRCRTLRRTHVASRAHGESRAKRSCALEATGRPTSEMLTGSVRATHRLRSRDAWQPLACTSSPWPPLLTCDTRPWVCRLACGRGAHIAVDRGWRSVLVGMRTCWSSWCVGICAWQPAPDLDFTKSPCLVRTRST
jgi:hypothetical protein